MRAGEEDLTAPEERARVTEKGTRYSHSGRSDDGRWVLRAGEGDSTASGEGGKVPDEKGTWQSSSGGAVIAGGGYNR